MSYDYSYSYYSDEEGPLGGGAGGGYPTGDASRSNPTAPSQRNKVGGRGGSQQGGRNEAAAGEAAPSGGRSAEGKARSVGKKRAGKAARKKKPDHLMSSRAQKEMQRREVQRVATRARLNHRNGAGEEPLHLAAAVGNLAVIDILLENGADIDAQNDSGQTALFLASKNDNLAVVERLLHFKANLFVYDNTGKSALSVAASDDIVYALNSERLIYSAGKGLTNAINKILDTGVDINVVNSADETALYHATLNNREAAVRLLLDLGARVDVGRNPLDSKVCTDQDIYRRLVIASKYATRHRDDDEVYTQGDNIVEASKEGNLDLVESFLAMGIDVDAYSSDGYTALHKAAYFGHIDVVQRLLEAGADTTIGSASKGDTAVHYASLKGHVDIVELLVTFQPDAY